VPDPELEAQFDAALRRYQKARIALVPFLVRIALDRLAGVLPGAREFETEGRFTEDWIPTLRIQRVRDDDGTVLFDISSGHPDPQVEAMIDEVNSEYLDLLLDLTGDTYMGHATIDHADASTP
jgi:hypothetical protein